MNDSLGDRMKGYEDVTRNLLPRRSYTIIRLDGVAFHSFTRGFRKPFDGMLIDAMNEATLHLCSHIQNVKMAFVQSDEISLILADFDKIETDQWHKGNIQKMASVSASRACAGFNKKIRTFGVDKLAEFDSRVFTIPSKIEVCNYFIWRQKDWTRNSVQMMARSMYSQKQLHGRNRQDLQELIFQKGKNWNDLETYLKRGRVAKKVNFTKDGVRRSKWMIDNEIPIFSKDWSYMDNLIPDQATVSGEALDESRRIQK